MRYLALATDYDGTLAHHGRVGEPALAALERLRKSGRRLLLVTGREMDDLQRTFSRLDLFDRVVAENGALVYRPDTREEKVLAEPPPAEFVRRLEARGVGPISMGRVIVATWEPHQAAVLETIHDMGLELQVIFNKGAVMVLPSGVNKATGLAAALTELGLSRRNAVAVGDAENDHAFLGVCECAVAVSNALPALQGRADWVTRGDHGAGVVELVDRLLEDDLASLGPRLTRHAVLIGRRPDGAEERLDPYGQNVLVAGTSGSGKSTLTTGLLERLCQAGYHYVIVDPEGDYDALDGAVVLGDPKRAPLVHEVLELLAAPGHNAVVNLLGVALEHRPAFFNELLPRVQELRARTGRPHWLVIDEAHHLMPTAWAPAHEALPRELRGVLAITVHPESVAPAVVESVDLLLAVGESPEKTVANFCKAAGRQPPRLRLEALETGEALAWRPKGGAPPVRVRTEPPHSERRRHSRKYAEGSLPQERSFRFRGPEGKLNLRAQNLVIFLQMADGVDDDTWRHHLRRGDYSAWFRDGIKDKSLAEEAARVEAKADELSPRDSRAAVREAIEKRYTFPADKPSGDVAPGDGLPKR
jgi:hydroxymethylpyrimidine pyrophosphatase-like HAD family hydrolase